MKHSFFLPIALAAAVLAAAGCASQKPSVPPVNIPSDKEPVSTSSTEVVKQDATSTVTVVETRPECQRIEDDYTGPIFDSIPEWLLRVEKYPIAEKYKHLEIQEPIDVGEGGASILARLFTAADCSKEQVERLMGAPVNSLIPLSIRLISRNHSPELLKLLQSDHYAIFRYENDPNEYFVLSPARTTIFDVMKLKEFARELEMVDEQG